jgi:hypothetical protein
MTRPSKFIHEGEVWELLFSDAIDVYLVRELTLTEKILHWWRSK